jgi:hypothetical protein|nr:MAG TPA: Protein of unknown function (DUF2374) [Caudoviricetes sp.]
MSVIHNVAFLFAMVVILLAGFVVMAGILQIIEDFWKGNPGD